MGKETIERYLKWEACNCLSEETWACLNHFLCTVHRFGKSIHRVHHFLDLTQNKLADKGPFKAGISCPLFYSDMSPLACLSPRFPHHTAFFVFCISRRFFSFENCRTLARTLKVSLLCLLNRYSAWNGASNKLTYFWSCLIPSLASFPTQWLEKRLHNKQSCNRRPA